MARKSTKLVGEVCLYGASGHGFGYIARLENGRMFGDGELHKSRSCTAAMWHGLDAIKADTKKGIVRVYLPGGQRMGEVQIESHWPTIGDMPTWAADYVEIPMEAVLAAAER